MALLTREALGVPVVVEGLDDAPYDEFITFPTAGGEEHLEVVLAVASSFEHVEHVVREGAEALRTPASRS